MNSREHREPVLQANRGRALEDLLETVFERTPGAKMFSQANVWVPLRNGKAFPKKGAPVDFVGVLHGVPVAVECKETAASRLPLGPERFPEKEVVALQDFVRAGGRSYVVAAFWRENALAVFTFDRFFDAWLSCRQGKKKSLSLDDADTSLALENVFRLSEILAKERG